MIKYLKLILITTLLALYNLSALAANVAGNVELAEGKVWIQGADNKMRAIKPDQPVYEGDIIITGADGELQVRMKDDAFIAVRPNSKLKIESYRAEGDTDDRATFNLLLGTFRSVTGWIGKYNRENYSINTRTATIGVRGTDHEPMYIPPAVPGMPPIGEPGVYDKVNSGRIVVKNAFGETEFEKGQAAFVGFNTRIAAVQLKGVPDFFKPSHNEQRIEDARKILQPSLDSSLQQRQQLNKGGSSTQPLLKPITSPDKNLSPELKPAAPTDDKTDNKFTPDKRPIAPIRSGDQISPVTPRLIPDASSVQPMKIPDAPSLLAPAAPNDIKTMLLLQPAITPVSPIKLAPAVSPTSLIQPTLILPIASSKLEQAVTTMPVVTQTLTPLSVTPMLINTQLTPTTTTTKASAIIDTMQTTPMLITPTVIQSQSKLLLPAR